MGGVLREHRSNRRNLSLGQMRLLWLLLLFLVVSASARKIRLYNRCPFTVWPGIVGSTIPAGGGLKLVQEQSFNMVVPEVWTEAKIWARTRCDEEFNCETGSCKNSEQCGGTEGALPATIAQFNLTGDKDYYSVSLLGGYNLPILIDVEDARGCKRAGGCFKNPNDYCPSELGHLGRRNNNVGCKTACNVFDTDEYCCRGVFNEPSKCKRDYSGEMYKDACPEAITSPFDDKVFTCQNIAIYILQFC